MIVTNMAGSPYSGMSALPRLCWCLVRDADGMVFFFVADEWVGLAFAVGIGSLVVFSADEDFSCAAWAVDAVVESFVEWVGKSIGSLVEEG